MVVELADESENEIGFRNPLILTKLRENTLVSTTGKLEHRPVTKNIFL